MDNELMWALIGLALFLIESLSAAQEGKVVANLRLSLYYTNPKHEAADGYCDRSFNDNWCDTYFNICVNSANSSKKCDLYATSTETHYDKSHVKYSGKNAFRIPLKYPVPEQVDIEISAYDNDRFTSHDLIATFENHFIKVPAANTEINAGLVKRDSTEHNGQVNITVLLAVSCAEGFYGEKCSVECFPEKYPSMVGCHENGSSICLPGFRGQFCERPDACFYKPCVRGAECVNVDTAAGYKCICGGSEGEHCYAGYNPCVPSPCKNQGQCVRTEGKHDAFACNCPIQWTGRLCDVQRSPCEVASQKLADADLQDLFGVHKRPNFFSLSANKTNKSVSVCKNGGICVDLMEDFKFICNCTSGWKGELCTVPDWTFTIITSCVVTGLLAILLCAIVPCTLRLRALHRKAHNPPGPLVYSHSGNEYPVTERIPFKDVFYNSVIISDSADGQNTDNAHQFYEYCTVTAPLTREGDLSTFNSNDYEISIEDNPPPELPLRPDSLAPLPKSQKTSACQDRDSLHSSRPESLCSRQPLITPRIPDSTPPLEGKSGNQMADSLPKRSSEDGESGLAKLLRISRK